MDYKMKYLQIRSQLLEATDVAYRLGYEEGLKEAQMKQNSQQIQDLQQQINGQRQPQIDPQTGEPIPQEGTLQEGPQNGMIQEGMSQGQQNQEVPIDQGNISPEGNIDEGTENSELDQHINELEGLVAKGEKPSVLSMRDAVIKLSELRKSQKEQFKRKHTQIQSSQKVFIDGLLKKWENESKKNDNDLVNILKEAEEKIKKV